MINSGLPETYALQTFSQSHQIMGIWDNSDSKVQENNGFWDNFSSSDEEDIKGMTRSGRFYEAADKGKGVVTKENTRPSQHLGAFMLISITQESHG